MEIDGDGGGGGGGEAEERGSGGELVPLLEAIKTSEVRRLSHSPARVPSPASRRRAVHFCAPSLGFSYSGSRLRGRAPVRLRDSFGLLLARVSGTGVFSWDLV